MDVEASSEAIFYGTEGKIIIPNYWKSDKCYLYKEDKCTTYEFPCPCEFVYQINHINDCLEKGYLTSPIMNKEKTIEMVRILDFLYTLYEPKKG